MQMQRLAQRSRAGRADRQLSWRRARPVFQAFGHLEDPACSSTQGGGKGARAGGPHAVAVPPGATPPHPGLAPAGSRWDLRHLLARTGLRLGPPGTTRGSHPETPASTGAWSQSLWASVFSSAKWGEQRRLLPPPAADRDQQDEAGRMLGTEPGTRPVLNKCLCV